MAILLAMCSALLEKSLKGGLVVIGELTLGGALVDLVNPVVITEIAVEKGANAILLPVQCRRAMLDLSDEMATKINVIYYSDARDALMKSIGE